MPLGDLERLKISAILHDIGKLECWANREGWSEHTKYTKQFVRSCFGEELAEDACRHHLGISYPDAYRPKTLTQQIICLADSIAAGADRHETPSHGPPIPTPPIEMTHVLSKDTVRSRLTAQDLAYLSQFIKNKISGIQEMLQSDPKKCYRALFEALRNSGLNNVPADTRRPINDVSLWDHLKLTAAFSACIALEGWKGSEPDAYQFALVSGDADRISKFINESLRLPDLNARSELIKAATEAAYEFVAGDLGPECVLFASGGSLLVLSPVSSAGKISEGIKKNFEEATHGSVTITVTYTTDSGGSFMQNFSKVWGAAMDKMRHQKADRLILPNVSVPEGVQPCDACKVRPATRPDPLRILPIDASPRPEALCDVCWEMRQKGKGAWIEDLKDANNMVGFVRADGDGVGRIFAGKLFRDMNKSSTPSRISTASGLLHRICEEELKAVVSAQSPSNRIIFAGGDDLLALVPGELALKVAKEVATKFYQSMAGACTMSAGVSIFNYQLPVYAGLEAASKLLRRAKDEGKNRVAFAVLSGTSASEGELRRFRSRRWDELGELLDLVHFMRGGEVTSGQLTNVARLALKDPDLAEVVIKNRMGRGTIGWKEGERLLSALESGILADAFNLYKISG
jgi:CRISPR/Cas system-associated protein Cas10 (large subunit of type III CRISPR-Cas system)